MNRLNISVFMLDMLAAGSRKTAAWTVICAAATILPVSSMAWEPNAEDLSEAIKTSDFSGYSANLSGWLAAKMPSAPEAISQENVTALLDDPGFAKALAQVHFVTKTSGSSLVAAAKDPSNRDFLTWILENTEVMVHCIEGVTPAVVSQRREAPGQLPEAALAIWKRIYDADPESKEGVCLKLAIAIAIYPPGTSHPGEGQAKTPADPLDRYKQFKAAHQDGQLVEGFADLSVWEYGMSVSCNASDEEMIWAREMINTWRPDLRVNWDVVNTTSEVWKRYSPIAYSNSYKNVLSGGGMSEPRASWAVFINQAFGIPAVWVDQPGNAAAAYKAVRPAVHPQEGSAWKIVYGRGWGASLPGQDFYEGATLRCDRDAFILVEKIRWLSLALESPDQAAAVAAIAMGITDAAWAAMKAPKVAPADGKRTLDLAVSVTQPEAPIDVPPGVLHVEAEAFTGMNGAHVHDCYTGGKQVNFGKLVSDSWVDYTVDAPAAGTYELTLRVAAVNFDQRFGVSVDWEAPIVVKVPNSHGLWTTTEAIDIELIEGRQTLKVAPPYQRGVALRWLELRPKTEPAREDPLVEKPDAAVQ